MASFESMRAVTAGAPRSQSNVIAAITSSRQVRCDLPGSEDPQVTREGQRLLWLLPELTERAFNLGSQTTSVIALRIVGGKELHRILVF